MFSPLIASRAARLALRGPLLKAIQSSSGSPCAQILSPLPGAYREPTELWHHDNTERRSPVQTIHNEEELNRLIASAKPDSLVVVKFHAQLCSACKAIEGKFEETAAEFGDLDGQGKVHFAEVCFDGNRQLCDKMGIRSVPRVQIISGCNAKIADFSIAPLKYHILTSLLSERRDSMHA